MAVWKRGVGVVARGVFAEEGTEFEFEELEIPDGEMDACCC